MSHISTDCLSRFAHYVRRRKREWEEAGVEPTIDRLIEDLENLATKDMSQHGK